MHVAALILGILGLILCWIPLVGWLGVLLALVALILGIALLVKKDDKNKGFGVVGLVIGGIAFLGGLIIQIMVLVGGAAVMDAVDEAQLELDSAEVQTDKPPFD
jgi:hypothetical protein